jgi:signal transduction histidine kinase
VTQILVNLLSNAIKFTPRGGHISADCAASDDTVTLRVSDTGIGIAPEKLQAVFEPFVQLKEGLANRASGIGLGLAISRDLARAMQGDLNAESTEGHGTRFSLTLPRAREQQGA